MPVPDSQVAADLFTSLHLAAPMLRQPVETPVNRRVCPRRPFHLVQRIAPRRGAGIPSEAEFFEVPCYDLTQRGFSFFVANWPAFDSLVVEFDMPPVKV